MLSETKQELSGELALYPGSHRVLSKYFEEEAFDLALSEGMAGLRRHINAHRPLGPPVHILGKPGDVVIANYIVGHRALPNRSPDIRYSVYFRVHSQAWREENGPQWAQRRRHRPPAMFDPWHDWQPLKDFMRGEEELCQATALSREEAEMKETS